jgi:glycosyltransferase involved in cell wall biosynthesis
VLDAVLRFYKIPRVLMAPNEELAALIEERTGKPTYIMRRGVDTELFAPSRRSATDSIFRLGFVGRLTPEKDVRFLAQIEKALLAAGKSNFRFVVVGAGSERAWLEKNLQHADFTGLLQGIDLARAYANMDVFVFPSRSDTFGNVVLEAMASGVPPVVTAQGGPKFLVHNGVSGSVAHSDHDFIDAIDLMMSNPALHRELRLQARLQACAAEWGRVFDKVYEAYGVCVRSQPRGLTPALRRPN